MLQNLYAQCSLLVCAQPFQLQKRQISELASLLPTFANLKKITSSNPHGKCMFTVGLSDDQPPQYFGAYDESVSVQQRFFDLENIHDAFRCSNLASRVSKDLSLHLSRLWSAEPARVFERVDARNDNIDFAVGVGSVFSLLTDGVAPEDFIRQHHLSLYDELKIPERTSPASTSAKIIKGSRVNFSEGGLCLELNPIPTRLESGELLSVLLSQGSQITLTVIKWVRLVNRTAGLVGCELLSVDAELCVMQVIDEQGVSFGIKPALLLDNIKGECGGERLAFGNSADLQGKLIRIIRKKRTAICKLTEQDLITGCILVSQFSHVSEGEAFWY